MRQKSEPVKAPAEQIVKDIRRATRRHFTAEEKMRVVLEGLRGEESVPDITRSTLPTPSCGGFMPTAERTMIRQDGHLSQRRQTRL